MNNLVLEQGQFIRSVEISKNDVFCALLGAGASVTSGIPSAGDCIRDWKKSLYTSKHTSSFQRTDIKSDQVKEQIQRWLDSEGIYPAANTDEEYSFYVEECYPIEDDRRKFFQRICEKKQPSVGYKLLCLLHETGMIQSVWSPNFDDLGIIAAHTANLLPIDITLDTIERISRPLNRSELPYIKLHGDYKYGPLKNTTSELARQDDTFRQHLINYLGDKHLIVSGYSGRDESVMNTLMMSYSKSGAGRLYWCGYGRDIPPKVALLIETARAHGRTAYYIPTDGFDPLFISLANACTKDNELHFSKFKELLGVNSSASDTTKFLLPQTRIDTVIKSNLFQIGFPQEVFQFEFPFNEGEKPWTVLREATANQRIVAVPYIRMVYALGTLTDINSVFSERIKGKITRVPLSGFDLKKDTAFHSLLLSALVDLLASAAILPSDKRNLIWKTTTVSQKRINNIVYQTHAAVRLAITVMEKGFTCL